MTLSVYALPGKMLRMNQAADRSGQDRSILLRIHPLEWSRIDADQSESAVQTQSKADMSGLRDFTYGQFLKLNAASAAARASCHFAAVAINYKEACDGDDGWSKSGKYGLESQK